MYDSISQDGTEGFGYGANGVGEGYAGSLYGGDPGQVSMGGGGAQPGPVLGGGSGVPVSAAGGGMTPGSGVPGPRRPMGGRPTANAAQNSFKPMLSQILGAMTQPQGGQRRGLDPHRTQPVQRPINGFGPRPMPRPQPRPITGFGPRPGGPTPGPVQRPQPVASGGTLNAGRSPITRPAQRRV